LDSDPSSHTNRFPRLSASLPLVLGTLVFLWERGYCALDAAGEQAGLSPPPAFGLYVLFAVLVAASALFAAAEVSIFSSGLSESFASERQGGLRESLLLRLLDSRGSVLISAMAGKYLLFSAATLSLFLCFPAEDGSEGFWRLSALCILSWFVLLVFAEALPRSLSQKAAMQVALWTAVPLWLLHTALRPLWGIVLPMARNARVNGDDPPEDHSWRVADSVQKNLVETGVVDVALEEEEQEMIDGILDLRDATAAEIMTPRTEIEALSGEMGHPEMLDSLRKCAHSRVPIYHDTLDRIIGILLAKEVLLNPSTGYRELMRLPIFVPGQQHVSQLLRDFKRNRSHLAVVVDEYGGVAGIVTLHDILEEIVGEILDPADSPEVLWREFGSGRVWVSGSCALDEAGERLEVEFPSDMGQTLGGFIMNNLADMPQRGSIVRHKGLQFRVVKLINRRIEIVEVQPDQTEQGDGGAT
jgi:putative hemolysin